MDTKRLSFGQSGSNLFAQKFVDLSSVINMAGSSITISDPNKKDTPLVYVNQGFQDLTGYSAEEILGRNCRFLQRSDRDQAGIEKLRDAIKNGKGCTIVLRNYRKDGTLFYNELYTSSIFDEQGKLAYFMGVQNDVTERINREMQLERMIEKTIEDASWLTQSVVDNLVKIRTNQQLVNLRLKNASVSVIDELTNREHQVLGMMVEGLDNSAIAQELDISPHTVRNYVTRVYDKLGVNKRSDAIIHAIRSGFVASP